MCQRRQPEIRGIGPRSKHASLSPLPSVGLVPPQLAARSPHQRLLRQTMVRGLSFVLSTRMHVAMQYRWYCSDRCSALTCSNVLAGRLIWNLLTLLTSNVQSLSGKAATTQVQSMAPPTMLAQATMARGSFYVCMCRILFL